MNQFMPFQPGRTINQPVVNVGRNGLRFNAKTFGVLHRAAYIRGLLDTDAGKFAIQAYEKAGVDSIPFTAQKPPPSLPGGTVGRQGGAPSICRTAMTGRSAGIDPAFLSAMVQKYGAQRWKAMEKSPSTYRKRCAILGKTAQRNR